VTTHRLPTLTVDAPIDRRWRWATFMLGACVGAALGWWASAWLELGVVVSVLLASSAMFAAALAARSHLRAPAGVLACDGQDWTWSGSAADHRAGALVTTEVIIDAQSWLLLRLTPVHAAGTRGSVPVVWLPLSRAAAPQPWHVLRAALHAQPSSASVRPSQPVIARD
jgi:hypothetical protein